MWISNSKVDIKKDLYETHWNIFYDVSFHSFLYKHDIFYIYYCYFIRILAILSYKYKEKLIKPSSYHMHDRHSKNCWYSSPTILTENTEKNIYLKLDLPD